jgi:hypothetical protein
MLGFTSIVDLSNWHLRYYKWDVYIFNIVISLACKYYQPKLHA